MTFGCEVKSTKDRSYGYGSYTKRFTKKLGESSIRKAGDRPSSPVAQNMSLSNVGHTLSNWTLICSDLLFSVSLTFDSRFENAIAVNQKNELVEEL